MKHKVALILIHESYDYTSENDYKKVIPFYVTDWTEVTDEELKLLNSARYRHGNYVVIECIKNQDQFIAETVKDQLKYIESLKEKEEQRRKILEKQKLEKKKKREQKQRISEKEQYEILKKKFEK